MWFDLLQRKAPEVDFDGPMSVPWEKNPQGRFWKLLRVHPETLGLAGRGGVAAFFRRGQRPGWLFVCATADLADLLLRAQDDADFLAAEARGGVFVTWSFVKPEFREGVVAYLRQTLDPEIATSDLDGFATYDSRPPIPVRVPA